MKRAFSLLQKIGKSLMLPVSVLPAAGLLLRLGQPDLFNIAYMAKAGDAIFSNLPMIFAVGVAIGFSGGEGVAALAAVVGQLILESIINVASSNAVQTEAIKAAAAKNITLNAFMNTSAYKDIVTVNSINMGVFGGIVIGIMAAVSYNRYHNIKFPQVLGFFAGKRFIPIITSLAALVFSILGVMIWPPIQHYIDIFAKWASTSILGPAFYAAGKRLLIPIGLHHIYYPAFLFQFGSYTAADGVTYFGDSARYFHGDPTAGVFMASEYPILMFGLPGAAFAMIAASKAENRKKIFGIMLSAAFVSFLTGITEPIEFSFIFVAPILFVFHVFAAFSSGIVTSLLHIRLGYTFSASAIDYTLGYKLASHPLWIWPIGIIYFTIYFLVFFFLIRALNIKTPGREEEDEFHQVATNTTGSKRGAAILEAIGGKENLEALDACITRLRLTLKDSNFIDKAKLKATGSAGIFEVGNSVQIIYGTEAEKIKDEIKAIITSDISLKKGEEKIDVVDVGNIVHSYERQLKLTSPMNGEIIKLEEVPDEVFSSKLLGDGFAIKPEDNKVYSPADGTIEVLFPTKHALAIKTVEGPEVLIHVGVDTVKLNGEGFTTYIKQGDKVKRGDLLISFNYEYVLQKCNTLISPVIVTNMKSVSKISVNFGKTESDKIVAIFTTK